MFVDAERIEPAGAALRMQRANGRLRLLFKRTGNVTTPQILFQEGSAKARLPRAFGRRQEVVLINTAGGLAGGDTFSTEIELGEAAELAVTTQACERVYRSSGEVAEVRARLRLGAGARLAWLPQETILFDAGRLRRSLEADLAPDAQFLSIESLLLGRSAMGETVRTGLFHDRWRIRRDGKLIFADDLRFEGDVAAQLARPAILAGNLALATILYVGANAEAFLDPVRHAIRDTGGASSWGGKLLIRIAASDGLALRSNVIPALSILMNGQPLPKLWQL